MGSEFDDGIDDRFDDDTTESMLGAGVDPLIASPKRATGLTGQIERPGDQTPWWFVPGLALVSVLLFALLLVVVDQNNSLREPVSASPQAAATEPDVQVSPTGDSTATPAPASTLVTTTVDPRLDDLPPVGFIRYQGSDREIRFRCEVHRPFAPADTEFTTSSYFFFDSSGISQLIDRIDTPDGTSSQLHRGDFRFVELVDIGDQGAFAATFDRDRRIEVIVNPGDVTEQNCGDRVVTNAPGQFAEPHAQIVLDVCLAQDRAGRTVVGTITQGGRFEILQAGGELAEVVYDRGDGQVFRSAAPAFLIRADGILSASAVVTNGTDDLDITIDIGTTVGEDSARPCSPSDRL